MFGLLDAVSIERRKEKLNTKTVLQEREQLKKVYGQPMAISEINARDGKMVIVADHTGRFEPEYHLVQAGRNLLVNRRGSWKYRDIKKGYCSVYLPLADEYNLMAVYSRGKKNAKDTLQ